MAAIVHQINKKTGVIYVYESISYWDKDKKQSRAKRKCIGRIDPQTKKVVPTKKREALPGSREKKPKRGPMPITRTARCFFGATYLFDRIGEETGVTQDLKTCFPEAYRQILSIAYYLTLEDRNPLSRFPRSRRDPSSPSRRGHLLPEEQRALRIHHRGSQAKVFPAPGKAPGGEGIPGL